MKAHRRGPRTKVEFVYSGIRVRDLEVSLKFYRKVGFRVLHRGTMVHGGTWVHLLFPGAKQRVELNYYPRGNRFYEPIRSGTQFDHFGFFASDMPALEASLRRKRLRVVAHVDEPKWRIVYIADPDGNWLEFFGRAPRARPRD